MKRWSRYLLLFLVSSMMPDRHLAAQVVNIPDPALEVAIRDTLAKPEGDLTVADMESLTELDLSLRARGFDNPAIANLAGLEPARNLVTLDLSAAFVPLWDALRPGDHFSCYFCTDCSLGSEGPGNLFDGWLTKWVGFSVGECAGFAVSPSYGPTLIRGIRLQSANDRPGWDPKVMVLKGSNSELLEEPNYELIVELQLPAWSERFGTQTLFFSNDRVYRHYLLEVTQTQDAAAPATHLAELELLVVRPPALPDLEVDLSVLGMLPSLRELDLSYNQLTNLHLPQGLNRLQHLDLSENQLTSFDLPEDLGQLARLDVSRNHVLASLGLPRELDHLEMLSLSDNSLPELNLPPDLGRLASLDLRANQLTELMLPGGLTGLRTLHLSQNPRFHQLSLPAGLSNLSVDISGNYWLTNLVLEGHLDGIVDLGLYFNRLTELLLPHGLTNLTHLRLHYNELAILQLPDDLLSLEVLYAGGNHLTELTIPPTLRRLTEVSVDENPLRSLTLPAGRYALYPSIPALRDQGTDVTLHPVLNNTQWLGNGSFRFVLWADQGVLDVDRSIDLQEWQRLKRVVVGTPNEGLPLSDDIQPSSGAAFYRVKPAE